MHRGHSFLSANEELLARYAACPTSAEVIAVQAAYLAELQAPPRPSPGAPEIRVLGLSRNQHEGLHAGHSEATVGFAPTRVRRAWARRDGASALSYPRSEHVYECMLSERCTLTARELTQGAVMTTWRPWTCRHPSRSRALTRRRRAPRTTPTGPAGAPLLGQHGPFAVGR